MNDRSKRCIAVFSFVLVTPLAAAQGPGAGGVRGLSSPRGGLGIRSNPVINPAPSLTPNQVLNPRGSLSTGQVLNPAPSLRRPPSGGPTVEMQHRQPSARKQIPSARKAGPSASQIFAAGRSTFGTRRPATGYSTASHFAELSTQLRRFKNGESWANYLVPPMELLSDETAEDASVELRKRLMRFDKLSIDPTYAQLTALPAFWLAHESLKLKVGQKDPLQERPPVGDRILQEVTALDAKINTIAPGSEWAKRLSLDELRATVSTTNEQPSTNDEREITEKILEGFQEVANNEADAIVNELPEFTETLKALQEYLKPGDKRTRENLSSYFDQLDGQLRMYTNGKNWANYLALPMELRDAQQTAAAGEPTRKLLKRFDRLSGDPAYAEVTALIAFRPAHEALKLAADQTDISLPPSTIATINRPTAALPKRQPVASTDTKPAPATRSQPTAAGEMTKKMTSDAPTKARPRIAERSESRVADAVTKEKPVGEKLLKSVMALDQRLAKATPDKGLLKRLSIDELEATVSMTSDQPSSDSDRKSLEKIARSYRAIAKDKDSVVVNQLKEFKETLDALEEYLSAEDS